MTQCLVRSTYCSCKGPDFISQHQHGCLQPSDILVPGALISSSVLWVLHAHGALMYTVCRPNTGTSKIKSLFFKDWHIFICVCERERGRDRESRKSTCHTLLVEISWQLVWSQFSFLLPYRSQRFNSGHKACMCLNPLSYRDIQRP